MTEAGTRWTCAGRSDRGAKRKINEDSILLRTDAGVWLAADGMGGHEAGDVASRMVAEAVARVRTAGKLSEVVDRVEDALVKVNLALREHAARAFGGRTMGSTVVSLVANDRLGVCLWAGDSRLYRLRDGRLQQLSRDHSEVQELVDRGLLTEEDAVNHPNSNVITRAVGGVPDLFLDAILFEIRRGDVFVLCSDGLYNELSADEIRGLIGDDLDGSADRLIQATLAKGARDNVSLVLVRAEVGNGPALVAGEGDALRRMAREAMSGATTREQYAYNRRQVLDRYAGEEPLSAADADETQPGIPVLEPVAPAPRPGPVTSAPVAPSPPAPAVGADSARDLWIGVAAVVVVLLALGALLAYIW